MLPRQTLKRRKAQEEVFYGQNPNGELNDTVCEQESIQVFNQKLVKQNVWRQRSQYLKYSTLIFSLLIKFIFTSSPNGIPSLTSQVMWIRSVSARSILFLVLLIIYFVLSIAFHVVVILQNFILSLGPKQHQLVLKSFTYQIAVYGSVAVDVLDSFATILIQQCDSNNLTSFLCILGYIDLSQRFLVGITDSYYSQYLEAKNRNFKKVEFWETQNQQQYSQDFNDKALTVNLLRVSILSSIWTKLFEGLYAISIQLENTLMAGNGANAYIQYVGVCVTYLVNAMWVQYIRQYKVLCGTYKDTEGNKSSSKIKGFFRTLFGLILDLIKVGYLIIFIYYISDVRINYSMSFQNYYHTYSDKIQQYYLAMNASVNGVNTESTIFLNNIPYLRNELKEDDWPYIYPTNQSGVYVNLNRQTYYLAYYQQQFANDQGSLQFGVGNLTYKQYADYSINSILQGSKYQLPQTTTVYIEYNLDADKQGSTDSIYSQERFSYLSPNVKMDQLKQASFENYVQIGSQDLIYQVLGYGSSRSYYLSPVSLYKELTNNYLYKPTKKVYAPFYLYIDYYIDPLQSNCYLAALNTLCSKGKKTDSQTQSIKDIFGNISFNEPPSFKFNLNAEIQLGLGRYAQEDQPYEWGPEDAVKNFMTTWQLTTYYRTSLPLQNLEELQMYVYDEQAKNILNYKDKTQEFYLGAGSFNYEEIQNKGKVDSDPHTCALQFCSFPQTVFKRVMLYGNVMESPDLQDYQNKYDIDPDISNNFQYGIGKVLEFQLSNNAIYFDHLGDVKKELYTSSAILWSDQDIVLRVLNYGYHNQFLPQDQYFSYGFKLPLNATEVEVDFGFQQGNISNVELNGLPIDYLPIVTNDCQLNANISSKIYDKSFCNQAQPQQISTQAGYSGQSALSPNIEQSVSLVFGSIYLILYLLQYIHFSSLNYKYTKKNILRNKQNPQNPQTIQVDSQNLFGNYKDQYPPVNQVFQQ